MTIDERLDRLAERHEALTQSVELMRLEGQEQGKRIAEQGKDIDRVLLAIERTAKISAAWHELRKRLRIVCMI
jgi:hypothetical protein